MIAEKKDADAANRLWQTIRGMHANPVLAGWLSLESVPLKPTISRTVTGEVLVHVLVACPVPNSGAVHGPWAFICWLWPSLRIACVIDLKVLPEALSALPAGQVATGTYVRAVQQALEDGQPGPSMDAALASQYTHLLKRLGAGTASAPAAPAALSAPPEPPRATTAAPAAPPLTPDLRVPPLLEWVGKARGLAARASNPAAYQAPLRDIAALATPGQFEVAIVGEFSRGKSTLVNRLLGEDVLPVGDLPTTAMLCRIRHGTSRQLTFVPPDRSARVAPLEPASWEGLLAGSTPGPEGVVEVELASTWLHDSSLRIIDTPGAGDLSDRRAELACEAISRCEGAIVAVSATMPLSLTERAFVQQAVLARRIPRVAVAVTRLDQVPEEERGRVLAHLRTRLDGWLPGAALWTTEERPGAGWPSDVVAGTSQIREELTRWAASPERMHSKARQGVGLLEDLSADLARDFSFQASAAQATDLERKQAKAKAKEGLQQRQMEWEQLRLQLMRRQRSALDCVEQARPAVEASLLETLQYELGHVPNPKEWWERDLPFRLQRELDGRLRPVQQELQVRLERDSGWLNSELAARFSLAPEVSGAHSQAERDRVLPASLGPELEDPTTGRRIVRYGMAAISIVGIAFPPVRAVALVASSLGAIYSEVDTKRRLEGEREKARQGLAPLVARAVEEALGSLSSWAISAYSSTLEGSKAREARWHEAEQRSLDTAPRAGGNGAEMLMSLRRDAESFGAQVRAWMAEAR